METTEDDSRKAEELAEHDYFNANALLSYLVKLHIVERWYSLDREKGETMFKSLVNEVRGTFKGINPEDYARPAKRQGKE